MGHLGTVHAVSPPPSRPAGPGQDDPVLVSVLSALAGVRSGDAVASVGTGARLEAALLAASGTESLVDRDARVVVAAAAHDVPVALSRLGPGGRLVALAADAAAAHRVAGAAGLQVRHVERLGSLVAWSAVRPLET
jgi:protein-L-isoaspartate O-methyltransferase